ncbi:hypothetical protein [Cellulomonas denverensis]|uniref:Uncharacterized protein n=1 Tax=Cellulomonas denverensis TaxID=264297 RepID=A0A7X6KW74_9CELL|nr:hypothetical protein [Cellulomonas denverensis]NKY23387.1 hypothetical protein [Cellulomonas denverensis]
MVAAILLVTGGNGAPVEARNEVTVAAGFPEDFPLAEGTLVESRLVGDRTHTATVQVDSTAAQDAALQLLADAGFLPTGEIERDDLRSYSMVSAGHAVTVVLKEEGGVPVVTYTIAPR